MEFAQKLISTRKGSLYVALVAAGLAAISILVFVNRYRDSVNSGNTPVTVLVASQAIEKGTPGAVVAAKTLYTTSTIKESQLLEGAFSDPTSLRGRVATADIAPGSQLKASDFSATTTSLASTLTDDQRLLSIPLDGAHGLIGSIRAGDHVDIYAGFNVIPVRSDGTPANGGQARPMLRRIVANVPVAEVGTADSGVAASRATNVTLKVNDADAARLAFASDNGKIWIALRPAADAKSSRPDIVTVETLLLGVSPVTALHSLGGRR